MRCLRLCSYWLLVLALHAGQVNAAEDVEETLVLDGHGLTLEHVVAVARHGREVAIDDSAFARTKRAHELLLVAASKGLPIYGLNRGVGLNKDKTILGEDGLDSEVRKDSERFNLALLRSHSAAVKPPATKEVVRAAMLVRANTILLGHTGAQPEVAELLVAFLNHGIHPVVPSRGSVGEADITLLAHIGLTLCGEGLVSYKGSNVKARMALDDLGLEALRPFAKDALSIVSSNAFTAGRSALVMADVEATIRGAELISALSLEGLNGNVAPLLQDVVGLRGFEGVRQSAARTREYLKDSYLWNEYDRPLQDPLSFRSQAHVHGAAFEVLNDAKHKLETQLNSSDDNPAVILGVHPAGIESPVVHRNYVAGTFEGVDVSGAVIPTANFEPIPWVLSLQSLGNALRHVSSCSVQRMTRLDTEHFTKLTRFLAANDESIAFGTIQKTYVALDVEIRALSNPVSADAYPVAGGIEDHASNAPLVIERIAKITDNLRYILGMELMHASQAVDLRIRAANLAHDAALSLGESTSQVFLEYRKHVPTYEEDRALSPDIEESFKFVLTQLPQFTRTLRTEDRKLQELAEEIAELSQGERQALWELVDAVTK